MTSQHRTLSIETIGSTTVHTCGTGRTLLVVHGGPGLSHEYLVDSLRFLAENHRLVFYDQHEVQTTSGGQPAGPLVDALTSLVGNLSKDEPISMVAHSWGAYLVYAMLEHHAASPLHQLVLVSPIGLTKARFDESGNRLIGRTPENVLAQLERLAREGKDKELMDLIFPYYLAPQSRRIASPVTWYSNELNESILDALPDFDFTQIGPRLPASTLLVYGSEDIEDPSATAEIHSTVTGPEIIAEAGHFSFLEQPQRFAEIVSRFVRP